MKTLLVIALAFAMPGCYSITGRYVKEVEVDSDEMDGAALPSLIPPGMRAVSIRVNEIVAITNPPGNRVNVL